MFHPSSSLAKQVSNLLKVWWNQIGLHKSTYITPMTIKCIILQHPIALRRYIVNIDEYWILHICTSSRSAPEKLHSLWISANERHDVVRNILSSKKSTEYIWGETYPKNFFRARILVRDEASERIEHTFRVLKVHKKLAVHYWRLKPQTGYQYALNLSKDPDMQRPKMNNTLTIFRLHSSKEFNPTGRSPWLLLHLAALLLLSRPLHGAKVNKKTNVEGSTCIENAWSSWYKSSAIYNVTKCIS